MIKNALIILAFIVAIGLLPFLVMWLWNWLMPLLFSLPAVTYCQAAGLFMLSTLLFAKWNGGSHE
mgnify:CR=1 FL=1